MSRSIPTVKQWRVLFANGSEVEISAPTRRLAVLNVRLGLGFWAPIVSVGVLRKGRLV